MNKSKLVSVVIPCYNNSNTIERAVESVFADTHQSSEVIVINDGSTDDSLIKLQKLKIKYPEKIIVIDQVNSGANASRNAGLKLASGDYVQFLDGDDFLLNNKLFKSIELINKYPELLCVYSDGVIEDTETVVEASHENTKRIVNKKFVEFTFGMNTNMPIWNASFLRKTNEQWDENLGCCGFSRMPNHNGISAASNSTSYILSKAKAIKKILLHCEKNGLLNEALLRQSDSFMWLLFKQAILNSKDSVVSQISEQHKNKSFNQKLIYSMSPVFIRFVYKLKKYISF